MTPVLTPEQFPLYSIEEIPLLPRNRGNQKTKKSKFLYKDVLCTFDIETSRLTAAVDPVFKDNEQSILYLWAFHVHHHFTILGRNWDQLRWLFQRLCLELMDAENSDDGVAERLCIYVHNLSYEFQFLRTIYDFAPEDVFAVDSRRVLKCSMQNKLEFRCSYLHSNMRLEEYCKKMGAEHGKLSGADFDYSAVRFPWTPLDPDKIEYQLHDVWGLAESLEIEMEHDGDTLYTIPLTSTGYVRRDAKAAMRQVSYSWIRRQQPNVEIYQLEREAFRGGNTHANRYYADRILTNVHSADRSSSYPDVQCNDLFPVTQFRRVNGDLTPERIDRMVNRMGRALLFRCAFTGLRLTDQYWGCPYLSRDKCRRIEGGCFDNGRIISADYLETTITDVDFRIILSEYTSDQVTPFDAYYSYYGPLPRPLIEVTEQYYRNKTELKNVPGQELYYTKNKNKLNSIYGMSAQDIGKQTIEYRYGEWVEKDEPLEDIIEHNTRNAFQNYAWGVWVTAWARYRLEEGIRLAGHNFVYCDTDSVKYLGEIDWTAYNAERIRCSTEHGAFATDPSGVTHYMGVYEMEDTYARFATLGAKKYAYQYEPGGPTKVTIAGVTKSKGGAELDKFGGLERFVQLQPAFTFREAGGTEILYNDDPNIKYLDIDGHRLEIGPNAVIMDGTYTLGITAEYASIIKYACLPLDKWGQDGVE